MYWNKLIRWIVTAVLPLTAAVLPFLAEAQDATEIPVIRGPGECETCHAALKEDRLSSPTVWLEFDRHARGAMGCVDCHGGDEKAARPEVAHAVGAGFVGVPAPEAVPDLCGRCHANVEFMRTENPRLPVDQNEKYWTSRHGELLKMGLRKVAQCASCHTAHNVRLATDPLSTIYPARIPYTCARCHADREYMAGFPIPTDQFSKYAASVHGQALLEREDLGAPACNDCHGNHGAVPPGAESLAHVCGICHPANSENFEKSPHVQPFALRELPQCAVCHNHHAIAKPSYTLFAMGANSPCIDCHTQGDGGWEQGKEMYEDIHSLVQKRDEAEAMLDRAENLGMDVDDGRFLLQDYRKNFLLIRTLSHTLNMEEFNTRVDEASQQAQSALKDGSEAIEEYHFRRKGLLVALLLSFPVILFLWLKIRTLGHPQG